MEVGENSKKQWTKAVVNKQLSLLRSYIKEDKIASENYFYVQDKNRWKHNQHFELLFFKKKNYTLAYPTNYIHVEK